MNLPLLSEDELIASDLVRSSFEVRSERLPPELVSNLVFWLVSEFLYGRCAWLASAAGRRLGPGRYVAFHRPDGRLAHVVLASENQAGRFLAGECVDVMGRRTLASVHASLQRHIGTVAVKIDEIVDPEDFDDDEGRYLGLAEELPWFRATMGLDQIPMDGDRLIGRAIDLGFEPDRAPFP